MIRRCGTLAASLGLLAILGGGAFPRASLADVPAADIPPSSKPPALDSDRDWKRRSRAPGVVVAVGFDDIREWARYNWDRHDCNPDYQVRVDGKMAGCRNNAWDPRIRTSGKGSLRFDILPRTGEDGGGSLAIPFGDYATRQFGADSEFWVSWRQRMDERYYQGYRAQNGDVTYFKHVIIAQGDMPIPGPARILTANACSEAELVIVSSDPRSGPPFPAGYIECHRYLGFKQVLARGSYAGDPGGHTVVTAQNMRTDPHGGFNCISYPPKTMDQSGCFTYAPNEWITYMVHVKLGPEGRAVSSASGREQPGYTDSLYELYAARNGDDFQLLHRQGDIVIPKGQYYVGGDPILKSSYQGGWSPSNGHPQARYGKLWLLSFMTAKDPTEATDKASTWYDEVIVSRCPIAAPGYPASGQCNAVPAPASKRLAAKAGR
ncbi:MAG: exported protein of unknown function [Rhodocyclaceae bacterium]|nr:exported protein of unknown function [Rhodocyclaceae bacterium]